MSRQYTLCSFVRKQNIDIAIITALSKHYLGLAARQSQQGENEAAPFIPPSSPLLSSPCLSAIAITPVSFLSKVSSFSHRLNAGWRLPQWRARLPFVCEAAVAPHLHQNILTTVLSSSATPGRHPEYCISLLPAYTWCLLFSSLFLHHFFLTNTHQWPHSL